MGSVKSQVLAKLQSQEWTTSEELENIFPKGVKGHFSWPQRLRGLRDKNYKITRRVKAGTKNLSEWKIEKREQPAPLFVKEQERKSDDTKRENRADIGRIRTKSR